MSMVGLRVPEEAARILWAFFESKYDWPDTVPMEDAHVTLLHLGDSLPKDMSDRAAEALLRATADVRPFTVSTSRVRTFGSAGEDGTPIVCQIDSEPLHALRQRLAEAFDAAGVPYSKKYPEYKPHVTLAYSPDPLVDELFGSYSGFSPVEWGVHEVILWGGDKGLGEPSESFPLSVVPRTAQFRLAVKRALGMSTQPAHR